MKMSVEREERVQGDGKSVYGNGFGFVYMCVCVCVFVCIN